MLAQVRKRKGRAQLHLGLTREHYLAAVGRSGDSRTEMNVAADVPLPADVRPPGMQTHPYADGA